MTAADLTFAFAGAAALGDGNCRNGYHKKEA